MDIEYNNQKMNDTIDLSLTINNLFEKIDDCVQFSDYGRDPYTKEQLIHKAHHVE